MRSNVVLRNCWRSRMYELKKDKCPFCGEEIDGLHNCKKSPRHGTVGWQCPSCGVNYPLSVKHCDCTKKDVSHLMHTPPMSWIEGGTNGGKVA